LWRHRFEATLQREREPGSRGQGLTVTTDNERSAPVESLGEHTRASLALVRVSGGVVCSYCASLAADGLMDAVRTVFSARSGLHPHWLEEVTLFDWCELEHFRTLLVSYADVVGLERLREDTRRRLCDSEHSNVYAPVLRSWVRSFGNSVELLLRCVVPLWRAAFRHARPPEVLLMEPGELHLVMTGPMARALYGSEAMAAGFEGILLGILDLPRPRPLVEVAFSYERDEMLTICKF
jgi:hypothetical protein